MAERKQGPVKPPTIELTAREADAAGDKPARRSRRSAAPPPEPEETVPSESIVSASDADGAPSPEPQPVPPIPPTPPEPPPPPRASPAVARDPAPLPWGMLGTAAVAGALLGTALTYVLATFAPLPGPVQPDLGPALSTQADRVADLEQRLEAIEAGVIDTRASADTATSGLAGRIDDLEAALGTLRADLPAAADTSAIDARIRTLTSRVDAIGAGASSADAGAMAENIGDLEQDLAALRAEVEGVAARLAPSETGLARLETEVASLRAEIETAAAEPEPEPVPPQAPLALVAAALESAFATGRPYATELASLAQSTPPVVIDERLALQAGTGLIRPDALDRQFAAAVPLMLEARPATGEGWQESATDLLGSLLAIRPAGETEGDSPEAVVSRLEGAMSRHDYAAAAALFAALPPEMVAAA
jgi:hypothetical protein